MFRGCLAHQRCTCACPCPVRYVLVELLPQRPSRTNRFFYPTVLDNYNIFNWSALPYPKLQIGECLIDKLRHSLCLLVLCVSSSSMFACSASLRCTSTQPRRFDPVSSLFLCPTKTTAHVYARKQTALPRPTCPSYSFNWLMFHRASLRRVWSPLPHWR